MHNQSAKLEHEKRLNNLVLESLSDHTKLFNRFRDSPNFKRWVPWCLMRLPLPDLFVQAVRRLETLAPPE